MNNYKHIINAIDNSKSTILGGEYNKHYKFNIYPFGERGSYISYELIDEIVDGLVENVKSFGEFDYIVSPEPGGHLWGILVAYTLKKPINIIRNLKTGVENEVLATRENLYNETILSFRDFKPGDKVVIVDDVISSGNTINIIIRKLKDLQIDVVGVQAIVNKNSVKNVVDDKTNIKVLVQM